MFTLCPLVISHISLSDHLFQTSVLLFGSKTPQYSVESIELLLQIPTSNSKINNSFHS